MGSQDPQGGCLQKKNQRRGRGGTGGRSIGSCHLENPAAMAREQPLLGDLHDEGDLGKAHQSLQTPRLQKGLSIDTGRGRWVKIACPPTPKPVPVWVSPSVVSVPKDTPQYLQLNGNLPVSPEQQAALLGYVVRGDAFMKQTGALFCNICKLHVGF